MIDSLDQGGAEQSMMATLPVLAADGLAPELVLLRSLDPDRERALADQGVPVRVLPPSAGPLGLAKELRPMLRTDPPALLHATLFTPIVGGALAALRTRVPVLATQAIVPPDLHRLGRADTSGSPWKVRAAMEVEAFALRRLVTHVHAVTVGVREEVVRRFGVPRSHITVAERGRDPQRFRPPTAAERAAVRADLGVPHDAPVLVALGRHEPSKGFDVLVDAVALLVEQQPDVRLLLAGREGTITPELRAAIDRRGLAERMLLLGDRPDPERVLAAGDVFLLSSRREGTSGATIEAMATGLPVVATQLSGMVGVVTDGVEALLVPVDDPRAMAAAVVRVLEDPDLAARLGARGRRAFEDRFTIERSARALGDLYRDVAASGRRS